MTKEVKWEEKAGVATEIIDEEPPGEVGEVKKIGEAEKKGDEGFGQRAGVIERGENGPRKIRGEGKLIKNRVERRVEEGIAGFRKGLGDYRIEAKKINIMSTLPKIVGLTGRSFYSGGRRGWRGEDENFGVPHEQGNQLRKGVRSEMQEEGKRRKTERLINSIPLKTWEFWEEGRSQ